MKLWKISRPGICGCDEYDSAVVAAENEQAARKTHPNKYGREDPPDIWNSWIPKEQVVVELIGTAKPGTKPGVICASFHDG